MARFGLEKITKEKYPELFQHEGNVDTWLIFHERGNFPKLIGKTYTRTGAERLAKDYAKIRLKTKKIEFNSF